MCIIPGMASGAISKREYSERIVYKRNAIARKFKETLHVLAVDVPALSPLPLLFILDHAVLVRASPLMLPLAGANTSSCSGRLRSRWRAKTISSTT
jgi:hypothetical protein